MRLHHCVTMMSWSVMLLHAVCVLATDDSGTLDENAFIQSILVAEKRFEANVRNLPQNPASTIFQNKSDVCYDDDIGCFNLDRDFKHTGILPESPEIINTSFAVYWRGEHLDKPINIHYKNVSTFENVVEAFQTKRKLAVVTHGFGGSGRTFWVVHMKNALLETSDITVIAVDWRRGSSLPYYDQSVANTIMVGRQTAKLLQLLIKRFNATLGPDDLHFIGFSMGAQVAGFCGRHFETLTGRKMARLTALDPAAPGFERYGYHVTKSDAEFVDAVHTSAGNSIVTGKVGMVTPVGHVDIYPNGGISQPGCRFYQIKCNHERAHHYYREAVLRGANDPQCRFKATNCVESQEEMQDSGKCTPDTSKPSSEMGPHSVDLPGRGVMFLRTNFDVPFCLP